MMTTQVLTVTITSAELMDLQSLVIRRNPDGPGLTEEAHYLIRQEGGGIYKNGSLNIALSQAVQDALIAHLESVVLPAINQAEGFV